MAELLNFEHVEISYGGDPVVHDVSFSVKPGEILGLVGESGSGKSTLIKAAMGLLGDNGLVTKGDILFDGKNIPDLPEKELRKIRGAKIGMIFQDAGASLCPIRTIGAQIYESMSAHMGISRADAQEQAFALFEKLHFQDSRRIWDSYPFELSGGMNQRAGIARALAIEPRLLICDEATSALDVTVQQQIMELLARLRQDREVSYLFICHNLALVQGFCDRLLVMYQGKIVESGTPDQVIFHPQSDYTKLLIDSIL